MPRKKTRAETATPEPPPEEKKRRFDKFIKKRGGAEILAHDWNADLPRLDYRYVVVVGYMFREEWHDIEELADVRTLEEAAEYLSQVYEDNDNPFKDAVLFDLHENREVPYETVTVTTITFPPPKPTEKEKRKK